MSKKCLCFVLALLLMVPAVLCFAENDSTDPGQLRYSYINTVSASIRLSGSTAVCFGNGRGKYTNTTTHLLVTLQRKAPGSASWSGIKSWSTTTNGIAMAQIEESYTITSGYSYRVRVRCQIKDSSGTVLETAYRNSASVTY